MIKNLKYIILCVLMLAYTLHGSTIELIIKELDKNDIDRAYKLTLAAIENKSFLLGDAVKAYRCFKQAEEHKMGIRVLQYYLKHRLSLKDLIDVVDLVLELIEQGQFEIAYEYGSKNLELWAKQPAEIILALDALTYLLPIAILIESEYYYNAIKEKVINKTFLPQEKIYYHYEPYFKAIPLYTNNKVHRLNPELRSNSINQILQKIIRVDPNYLKDKRLEHFINPPELSGSLQTNIEDDIIIFELLHVIAINALKKPAQKIYIFYDDLAGSSPDNSSSNTIIGGTYSHVLKAMFINIALFDFHRNYNHSDYSTREFYSVLIHECTHQVMGILFENNLNPYKANDSFQMISYKKTLRMLSEQFNQIDPSLLTIKEISRAKELLVNIGLFYPESYWHSEYIVTLPQAIASGYFTNPYVRNYFKPLTDYWTQHIRPEIQKYIRENAEYDKFMCDWKKDCLFDLNFSH